MKYIIIRADSLRELEQKVNEAMNDGYSVQGGAVPYGGPDRYSFIQTLVKIRYQ